MFVKRPIRFLGFCTCSGLKFKTTGGNKVESQTNVTNTRANACSRCGNIMTQPTEIIAT